ncbi:FAD/NAD(P)-binding protein [Erwinia tasmaniensis]|uniref:FAD/NAD(P)-binding protein n=1 Tax=Erwinia tasmaniensis TaxID=338565 RepID=UPI003A4D1CF7
MLKPSRIAIVGLGPRGLLILESIILALRESPKKVVELHLFDDGVPGCGIHGEWQPDYLMLNTVAGQLSAFSWSELDNGRLGPTFLEWCHSQTVRLDERGYPACSGRVVAAGDFLPRRLLGRYLRDCYQLLMTMAPIGLRLFYHKTRVMTCTPISTRTTYLLHCQSDENVEVNAIFLTLGHTGHESVVPASFVSPVHAGVWPGTEARFKPIKKVAISGLGLTALDALSRLTEGRGGEYQPQAGELIYHPSGKEPQIYMFSPSGLPFHARPQWQQRDEQETLPLLFLTSAAVKKLREKNGLSPLDFVEHILPLIKKEMKATYYLACARNHSMAIAKNIYDKLATRTGEYLFSVLAKEYGPFDPDQYLNWKPWQVDIREYEEEFCRWIRADLIESLRGVNYSPVKAALEVWRRGRHVLREAVNHDGLNTTSRHLFYERYAAVGNRLVGGPHIERYNELLALIKSGILHILPPMYVAEEGNRLYSVTNPQEITLDVDAILSARVISSGLIRTRSPMLISLLQQGLISPAGEYPHDGIDTDKLGRVVNEDDVEQPRIWAFGPIVEGSTFYNHYVTTTDNHCDAVLETRQAVKSCISVLTIAEERLLYRN